MRLIDADALLPMMKYATTDSEIGVFPIKIGFNAIAKVIDDAPTIDAVPVRHGKWVYDPNGMDWNLPAWVCSECHVKNDNIPAYIRNKDLIVKVTDPFRWAGSKFCPNCGARMDADNA